MDEAESGQGQQRADLLDPLRTASIELRGASRRDHARLCSDLAGDSLDHAVDEREIAEIKARLDRARGRLAYDFLGPPDLDAPEPGGALEKRFRRDRDSRHDHATGIFAPRGDDVERRRRTEIDDDARSAQPIVRGDRVDDAVGADLLRGVVEDRHSGANAGLDEDRLAARDLAKSLPERKPERWNDARHDHFARRVVLPAGR